MQDLNTNANYLSSDQRNLLLGLTNHLSPENNEAPFTVVSDNVVALHPSQINYDYQPPADTTFSMADLAQGSFGGSIEPKLLQFKSPRNMAQTELRNTMLDFFDRQGEMVPKSLVKSALEDLGKSALNNNTLEVHYKSPLAIENTPSKTVSKIEDIKYASDNNADEVHIKVVPQTKEDRANMRKAQQQKIIDEKAQEKEIAKLQRIAKEEEEKEKLRIQAEELKQIRDNKHQQHQKATEVASSTKFDNPDELISTYESMENVANGSSSEITKEVLQKYNRLRQAFGLRHVAKVANMGLVQTFLNENRNTYKEIKKTHKPTISIVPVGRYKANNVTNATTILTSRSEPSLLPPIEGKGGGGGAAKQRK